jgi:hypothetical protein
VQVVDVLSAEKKAVAKALLKIGKGDVGWIWLGLMRGQTSSRIELPDQCSIALPGFGSANIVDAMAGPKAVGGAEGGQATLRTDACPGEDEDAIGKCDCDGCHAKSLQKRPNAQNQS